MSNDGNSANNHLHAGHRQRMWDKYRAKGLTAFEEHEMLEMLLFLLIPRANTNETAHDLINKFGSIGGVITSDRAALKDIKGVGNTVALELSFIGDLFAYIRDRAPRHLALTTTENALEYCEDYFRNYASECVTYFLMDEDKNVIYHDDIFSDSEFAVEFSIKKIMRHALFHNCTKLLLVHNHRHGAPDASNSDIIATRRISELMQSIDVEFIDHIIVKDGKAWSMRESGNCPGAWGR